MRRKISATYIYNSQDNTFKVYYNLLYERIEFNHSFNRPGCHLYVLAKDGKTRIEIAKKEKDIFHNRLKHEYVVYLNEPNKEEAVQIISDYILNQTEIEINYLEQQLIKMNEKRDKILDFKKKELE